MGKVLQRPKALNATTNCRTRQSSNLHLRWLPKMAGVMLSGILLSFLSFRSVLAQDGNGLGALFGGMILFYLLIFAVVIGVYIWMLVWVNNDAKQRGQSGCLPMALVFLFGPIGLIIWLLMRESK